MLKSFSIVGSLTTLVVILFPFVAWSDSTADLLLSLNCSDYKVEIWQNRSDGNYLYRSVGFTGELSLNKGSKEIKEGVKVYKFPNKNYEYWVWDGTLDSSSQGVLEVYQDSKQIMQRTCSKE